MTEKYDLKTDLSLHLTVYQTLQGEICRLLMKLNTKTGYHTATKMTDPKK